LKNTFTFQLNESLKMCHLRKFLFYFKKENDKELNEIELTYSKHISKYIMIEQIYYCLVNRTKYFQK